MEYECPSCRHDAEKWLSKCPNCGAWNAFHKIKVMIYGILGISFLLLILWVPGKVVFNLFIHEPWFGVALVTWPFALMLIFLICRTEFVQNILGWFFYYIFYAPFRFAKLFYKKILVRKVYKNLPPPMQKLVKGIGMAILIIVSFLYAVFILPQHAR
jgi:hypothetical protein